MSPTFDEDDIADALMDSLDEELDDVEERRKNPLLDYATRVENFGKLLESSTLVLELVPNSNDGEISVRTTQKETPSELGGTAQFRNLRLNMLNELRLLLSEAVEGQAPDHYQQLLTPEVRSAILSMILSELKNKKDLDQPWEEYRVLRAIEGIAFYEFEGYPVAVILDRHQSYRKGLLEVVEKIFRVPLADLLSMAGEQDLDSLNEDEIENLTVESEHILRSNARHVQGRISNLSVDPENESVNYEFVHRSLAGDLNNNREETFLDRYEYPNERGEISCAMLDVLMGLII